MALLLILNLYTLRIVVNVLGMEDYGIYNVVAGAVTMMSCLSSVLSSATQRFYSYEQGKERFERLQKIFSSSLFIFICASILVLLIGETIGLWFVNYCLTIPVERTSAANVIYQFALMSFTISLIQIPYSAAVISHEEMGIFTAITTFDYAVRLIAALIIPTIPFDRLITYGASLLIIQVILLMTYYWYCNKYYSECKYMKCKEKSIYKELLSFSGWTLWGQIAGVGMNQINTILVNVFFGAIASAARAISLQISTAITSFCNSFILAIKPPMIKVYASGDYTGLNRLFNLSNKFVYYSLFVVCLPLYLDMDWVLKIWLNLTDPQTVIFSRLILIYSVLLALNNPISIVVQATGNIKNYNIYVESFTLLCPALTYLLFELGCPAYTVYYSMIGCIISSHIVRLIVLKRVYTNFSLRNYLYDFIGKGFLISAVSVIIISYIRYDMDNGIVRFVITTLANLVLVLILVFLIGLKSNERRSIISIINNNVRY